MKRYLLMVVAALLSMQSLMAYVVENPTFEARNDVIPTVTRVEVDRDETRLHLRCNYKPNWWLRFGEHISLRETNGGKSFAIKSIVGHELGEKLTTPACGYQDVVLVFEPLDSSVSKVDFVEDEGWRICGIDLSGSADKGEDDPRMALIGNWSDPSGERGWCYGLYDDVAIIDDQLWSYKSVKRSGKGWSMLLKSDGETKQLYAEPRGEQLAIGDSPKSVALYTKDAPTYSGQIPEFDPLEGGKVTVQGYIDGYVAGLGYSTGAINVENIAIRKNLNKVVKIEEDGRFYAEFDLPHAQRCYMSLGPLICNLMLIPGETITIYINNESELKQNAMRKFSLSSDIRFMGRYGQLYAEYYGNCDKFRFDQKRTSKIDLKKIPAKVFNEALHTIYRDDSLRVERWAASAKVSDLTKDIARNSLAMEFYDQSVLYLWVNDFNKKVKPDVDHGGYIEQQIDTDDLPENYFDFLSKVDVDNVEALMLSGFDIFINRFEFSPLTHTFDPKFNRMKAVDRLVGAGAISATPLYKRSKQDSGSLDSLEKVELYNFYKEQFPLIDKLFVDSLHLMPLSADIEWRKSVSRDLWGVDDGLVSQFAFSRHIATCMNMYDWDMDVAQSVMDLGLEYITEPMMVKSLKSCYGEKYRTRDLFKSTPIPDGAGREVIERIIAPHRGKYVMVDFWGPGCAPCVSAIKKSHGIRERLKNAAVSFVFIACKDQAPIDSYNKWMDDTVGDKHRVSTDDWNKLSELFGISGIPRYILFDPEGKVVNDRFGGWNFIEDVIAKYRD